MRSQVCHLIVMLLIDKIKNELQLTVSWKQLDNSGLIMENKDSLFSF